MRMSISGGGSGITVPGLDSGDKMKKSLPRNDGVYLYSSSSLILFGFVTGKRNVKGPSRQHDGVMGLTRARW